MERERGEEGEGKRDALTGRPLGDGNAIRLCQAPTYERKTTEQPGNSPENL